MFKQSNLDTILKGFTKLYVQLGSFIDRTNEQSNTKQIELLQIEREIEQLNEDIKKADRIRTKLEDFLS